MKRRCARRCSPSAGLPAAPEWPDMSAEGRRRKGLRLRAFFIRMALCCAGLLGVTAGSARAQAAIGPGAIAVVLRDASGRPVAGALVVADGPVTRSATTGSAGIVTLQALPAGNYDVRVTRSGFAPLETTAVLAATAAAPTFLDLRVVATDLAGSRDAARPTETAASPADDPYVAHALAAAPEVDVTSGDSASAATVDGTSRNDTRAELDGIPLAAGSARGQALAAGSALPLVRVDVVPGLAAAPSDTPRNAVGGVIDYRTAAIDSATNGGLEAGYDSAFGSFQHARFSGTFGRVGVMADAVTGGGSERTQIVKARYAFSSATSLGVASYTMQSADAIAPIAAADLQTKLGTATFEARTYRSAARDPAQEDRVDGTQLGLDVPAGEDRFALGFDRRTESASLSTGYAKQTFSTLTARAGLQLARDVRLDLGDAYGGGTSLPRRHDPHATLLVRATDRVTLRASAGSAYATAPAATLATAMPDERDVLRRPETSFGYRAAADLQLDANEHAYALAYTLRRYDTFTAVAGARSSGVVLGVERRAPLGGFGGLAYVDLDRAYALGGPQPVARDLDAAPLLAESQLPGAASSKARIVAMYRGRSGVAVRLGTTLLGADNALSARALALGDAALAIPIGTLLSARIGVQNAFGARIADPILAREFAPHEVTFTLGRR